MSITLVAALFLAALLICVLLGGRLARVIRTWPTLWLSFAAFIYVPLMGALSIFMSYGSGFNLAAVTLGVIIFSVQWVFIFRSALFQSYWSQSPFRIAFVINSVVRIPVSLVCDIGIALTLLRIFFVDSEQFNDNELEAYGIADDFLPTLRLTLLHGLVIQLIYAIMLKMIYMITAFLMRRNNA